MIDIYLCEDDEVQLKTLKETVEKQLLMHDFSQQLVCCTGNVDELLNYRKTHTEHIGLYFLDIDLNDQINGLTLATKIREFDPRGYIVFITFHSEMSYLTFLYKVEAMDFILKDQPEQLASRVYDCMSSADSNHKNITSKTSTLLNVKVGGHILKILSNDILFICTADIPHRLCLHTFSGVNLLYGTIKEWIKTLDSTIFISCNSSTILNKAHIDDINLKTRMVTMENGKSFKISTRLVSKFKNLRTIKG